MGKQLYMQRNRKDEINHLLNAWENKIVFAWCHKAGNRGVSQVPSPQKKCPAASTISDYPPMPLKAAGLGADPPVQNLEAGSYRRSQSFRFELHSSLWFWGKDFYTMLLTSKQPSVYAPHFV